MASTMFKPEAITAWANEFVVKMTGLTKEAAQQTMVATAKSEFSRVMSGTPRPSGYRQFVNNVADAPLSTVTYDGIIIFAWHYLREVVEQCLNALILSSPIISGDYLKSIAIMLDDDETKAGSNLDDITPDTQKVVIVPTADYARRLEVGLRHDGSPFVLQVPLHNVELVARMLAGKFRDLADISFNYVDITPAYALSHDFRSRKRQPHETHVRYPAIIIIPKIAG